MPLPAPVMTATRSCELIDALRCKRPAALYARARVRRASQIHAVALNMSQACNTLSPLFRPGDPGRPTQMLNSMSIINLRRDLSVRFESATRQWLAARAAYRHLHDSHVKDLFALRDAAQRLDQVERGRNALLRDLKALSD